MTLSQKFWPASSWSGGGAESEQATAQLPLALLPASGCQFSVLPPPCFSPNAPEGALTVRWAGAPLAEDSRLRRRSQLPLFRRATWACAPPNIKHAPCPQPTSGFSGSSSASSLPRSPSEASCSVLSTLCSIPSACSRASRFASNSALSPEEDAPRSFACKRASSPVVSNSCCFISSNRFNSSSSCISAIAQPGGLLEGMCE